jgi:hypothetical protein
MVRNRFFALASRQEEAGLKLSRKYFQGVEFSLDIIGAWKTGLVNANYGHEFY